MVRVTRWGYLQAVVNHIKMYPTPINLNYFWGFGSLSFFFLISQIISGLLLAIYYTPSIDLAFGSVQHIMRDVNYGWLIRYIHSTGSSFFFIVVYFHISKAFFFGSYTNPRGFVWFFGVIIFILMMGIAFLGYVLPWGQMSFWAATVITNLVTVVPVIGESIKDLLWGGFSIGDPTLKRFFILHFLLPFVLLGLVTLHLLALHRVGSNNPLGVEATTYISFYPYFFLKDAVFLSFFLFIFFIGVCFYPNAFLHPDNYIQANPFVTPAHIVPEWYFLPFYAMLRAIPSKAGGIIVMGGSLIVLFFLPILGSFGKCRSGSFRPLYKVFLWFWFITIILLGWLGACPVEYPYIIISQLLTFYYFFFLLIIIPVLNFVEASLFELGGK